ncbi:prolyl oligopeptidase family serine peptidase [Geodermatophilaceae bacterium NBWT11]|nr:prolyl oligopeptidase family serine peptidase [Geodermatophilaceae bacterium NBWT11]
MRAGIGALAAALLLASGLAVSGPAGTARAEADPTTASSPVRVLERTQLTPRTLRLTIATDAFTAPAPVEVTLPVGYDADPQRRWPVTYYLHGADHDETTFRDSYDGEALTTGFGSIVVSPRGDVGFWSDWFSQATGPHDYETFVIDQLVPLIDATFRTEADRAHRAVMGESMGGFGVMAYAARHPDLFAAAASLSGGVDSNLPASVAAITAMPALQGQPPGSIFGDRLTQEVRWRGSNPADLVGNLRGVDLQLFTGNGLYDPTHGETLAEASAGCVLEGVVIRPTSVSLHQLLLDRGIAHRWVDLPWGCHGVTLFQHEIRQALPQIAAVFARPGPAPTQFDHRSIDPVIDVWGWTIEADADRELEFLDLTGAGRGGLSMAGSGATTVTTASYFAGIATVSVTVEGVTTQVQPDPAGRITFEVDLGPANRTQAHQVGAVTTVHTADVHFTAGPAS